MVKVSDVYKFMDFLAPYNTADTWDNTGLSVGSFNNEVKKIAVALDVTGDLIDFASENGVDLIVTHHPLIFHPLVSVESDTVYYKAVKSGISFLSAHTNLDKSLGGVNDCLSYKLGAFDVYTSEYDEFLKVGSVNPVAPADFAEIISKNLGGCVRYCSCNKEITKIAFCGGSGGDLINEAKKEKVDAFVTGDASHHDLLNAYDMGISMFAAGHFETENPVCGFLYSNLKTEYDGVIDVVLYNGEKIIKTVG